jgi:hypothetical protein
MWYIHSKSWSLFAFAGIPAACCSGAEIPPSGAAGMKGKVNRAEANQSEGGLIPLYHFSLVMATAQLLFDTPQLAAGSFILLGESNNV